MKQSIACTLSLPDRITLKNQSEVTRESYLGSLAKQWSRLGLLGIHEGSVISVEDSTLDEAQPPQRRDWIRDEPLCEVIVYFRTIEVARSFRKVVTEELGLLDSDILIEAEPEKDWNEAWRAGFCGLEVPGFGWILPSWVEKTDLHQGRVLRIDPGSGFGTGTHETTQLCLQLLVERSNRIQGASILDLGSGSGILSLAAVALGAREVTGVEIDPLAIDNARANEALNLFSTQVQWLDCLPETNRFDGIVANILRETLVKMAPQVCRALAKAPGNFLILSGLLESDVEQVQVLYARLLGVPGHVREDKDWRALFFVL